MEVRVPTALGFERGLECRGQPVRGGVLGLEPHERPLARLIAEAGVDAREPVDDQGDVLDDGTRTKAFGDDRSADHRPSVVAGPVRRYPNGIRSGSGSG